MGTHRERLDLLEEMIRGGVERGLIFHDAEDTRLDGRHVRVEGKDLLQFGSCSYLGLEVDSRLARGAIGATRRYGTQFSSSRGYLSAPAYG